MTPRERRAQVRRVAGTAVRALTTTPALVVVGVLGALAMTTAVLTAGLYRTHPAYLWLGGAVVVAVDAALLTHRARTRGRRLAGLPAYASPVLGLALVVTLVGVPWALAGRTSAGAARTLPAVLPWSVFDGVQLGDRVALASLDATGDTITMLDLDSGTARPVHLDSSVQWMNAAGDDLLVTTADGLLLLDRDGTELWRRDGDQATGQVPVAASDGVVVLANRALRGGEGDTSAVAVDRAGAEVWRRDGVTAALGGPLTAGGVLEFGAPLPTVGVLGTDGGAVAVDPATGDELNGSTSTPVAVLDDLVVWQDEAGDGSCRTAATRAEQTVWRVTMPCVGSVYAAAGHGVMFVHTDGPIGEPTTVYLDTSTGASAPLDVAWWARPNDGVIMTVDTRSDSDLAGRLVGSDALSGRHLWSLPAEPWLTDEWFVQTAEGTVAVTTPPLTHDPLAQLRTPQQVTAVDPHTGAITGWQRCRSGGWPAQPLADGKVLALCAQPDGSLRATVLG